MEDNAIMRTREQDYAVDIFARVEEFGQHHARGSKERRTYGSMAHKLPVLVRTAGLAQALAFVDARGDDAQRQLLKDLAATVDAKRYGNDVNSFLSDSRSLAFYEYMRLGQKVMAALLWYKRFAQSVLGVEPGEEDDGGGPS